MVLEPRSRQPYTGRMFRLDITPRQYADAFLDDLEQRRPPFMPKTIRNYGWALKWLTDVYPAGLPREVEEITAFVLFQEGLSPQTQQTLWDLLRVFYSWMGRRYLGAARELPTLPYVGFGERKRGEKRGARKTH